MQQDLVEEQLAVRAFPRPLFPSDCGVWLARLGKGLVIFERFLGCKLSSLVFAQANQVAALRFFIYYIPFRSNVVQGQLR
jgi:hypothetical protein